MPSTTTSSARTRASVPPQPGGYQAAGGPHSRRDHPRQPGAQRLGGTRTIDGARYILIRADEGVEVNGVNILI